MGEVLINPDATWLGRANAVLDPPPARRYESVFTGPLSVKTVVAGRAIWETAEGRYELGPGSALLLHDGEEYSITVDALHPVETFCFFFERGFVEDAMRAAATPSAALLDADAVAPVTFAERLQFATPLVAELQRARARLREGDSIAESFYAAALELAQTRDDLRARMAKLPALRASTRAELARRVERATSFLHANLDRPVTIAEAARVACLSPFHFHRLFGAFHGTTPHRYLTRLRLDRARSLLGGTTLAVADIALACGFEGVGSFTTLFTRAFGQPPARFRRNRETA